MKLGLVFLSVGVLFVTCSSWADTNEASFNPSSLKIPIWSINLADANGGNGSPIYTCTGSTEADCMVDLADSTSIAAVVAKAATSVTPATYSTINVQYCSNSVMATNGNSAWTAMVKGSVTIPSTGGTTYYTTSSATDPLSTSASNNDYVTVRPTGCNTIYRLLSPVTISSAGPSPTPSTSPSSTPNLTFTVNLFTTIKNMAWANSGSKTYDGGQGPCVNNGGTHVVCINFPQIIPYIGTVSPTLETYNFTQNGSATNTTAGQLNIVLDASGGILGAFAQRIYSQTSIAPGANGGFDAQVSTFSLNSDGSTYTVSNIPSGSTSTNGFTFPNFQRATHSGTGTFLGSSLSYTATKQ